LYGYDYSSAGFYFITLNTQSRLPLFGKIKNGEMILNSNGIAASNCWIEIPKHFPRAVLHEFVIMPDHIHGIIELRNTVEGCAFVPAQPQRTKNEFQKIIQGSIGSVIKGFKIGVTKHFRSEGITDKIWQRNLYDHIIRKNGGSFDRISKYIRNNPRNWKGGE
jgi:putative transposase